MMGREVLIRPLLCLKPEDEEDCREVEVKPTLSPPYLLNEARK